MPADTVTSDDAARDADPPINTVNVAAILFLLIGEADAAQLIGRLDPDDVRKLAAAVYAVGDSGADAIDAAISNFVAAAGQGGTLGHQAHGRIAGALGTAFGVPIAQAVLQPFTPPSAQPQLGRLRFLSATALAERLEGEHPQLVALICAHVDAAVATKVIQSLAEDEQEDILFRLATLEPVSADKLAEAEALVLAKPARVTGPQSQRGGTGDVAAILNMMKKGDDKRALKALARRDKDLARRIEEDMLTFDDLARLDDRGLGTLLRSVDTSLLVPALKGADGRLRARCLACMSSRAAQSIEDEMTERGPMPFDEVAAAQRAVVAIARRLGEEGVLMLGQGQADYV